MGEHAWVRSSAIKSAYAGPFAFALSSAFAAAKTSLIIFCLASSTLRRCRLSCFDDSLHEHSGEQCQKGNCAGWPTMTFN